MQQSLQEQLKSLAPRGVRDPRIVITHRAGNYIARLAGFSNCTLGSTPEEALMRLHSAPWAKKQGFKQKEKG